MSKERVKKLLGMTTANGCTEAEAMAAAEKAAKLMAELGLRPGDLEMDQDDYVIKAGWGSARSGLWTVISTCTNTAPITRWADGREVITYVGRDPGPEIATYLHQVTDRAIDRELRTFRATTWYKRRRTRRAKTQASQDFTIGMVARLRRRLLDLFGPNIDAALMEAATAEMDQRFPSSTNVDTRTRSSRYVAAGLMGVAAGNAVGLSHGVAGAGGAPLAITSR